MELHEPHPRFLKTPNFYTVEVGSTAVLECAIEDLEDRMVIWRKASDPNPLTVGRESFHNNDRFEVVHEPGEDTWNLVIHHSELTDAGVYECQVSSKLRHLRQHVLLTVKEKETNTTPMPRPDIKIAGTPFVEKDETIQLICNATGLEHPPDYLDWFLNGNKLSMKSNNKISIREFVSITSRTIVSILEISDAQLSDSGVYVCRTSNLQIESMRVAVLNADSFNVKRGTIAGNKEAESGRYASKHKNSAQVLHRHLLVSIVMVIALAGYWLFPS